MVILLPLLEGTDGVVKMSKTYPEHCIALNEEPKNMFGKLMSIPDSMIIRYYELLTDLSNEEINSVKEKLASGANPRDVKLDLAFWLTREYLGEEAAEKAKDGFISVVSNKELPEDMAEVAFSPKNILDLLVELGFVPSKGEAKRLIQGGGVKLDGEKIADTGLTVDFNGESAVLQAGKRKFARLIKC